MTEGAFRETVLEHKDRVFAYATGMLRHREEARDVAQEALVRLWEHREGVEPGTVRAWLLRTTHNLCVDRLRRRAVRLESALDGATDRFPDGQPDPERAALASVDGRRLEDALLRLEPRDRAIVLMREVQGMSYDEIARVLDLPLGTLKAALHRARERLRDDLVRAGVTP